MAVKYITNPALNGLMDYPVGLNLASNLGKIEVMTLEIQKFVKQSSKNEVNLLCRGSSGAIIGALILKELFTANIKAKVTHIKKVGESAHSSGFDVSNHHLNIIVDDFVSSGSTMNEIYERASKAVVQNEPLRIDAIAVSGNFNIEKLDFLTTAVICGENI